MSQSIVVLGASGYTGAEALRILVGHPDFSVTGLFGHRSAGQRLEDHWPQLAAVGLPSQIEAVDVDVIANRAQWALLALPHGQSASVAGALLAAGVRVVDLSADFRLDLALYEQHYGPHPCPEHFTKAVYGLPELPDCRESLVGASLIAGPGCYPTTVTLAVAPLFAAGMVARTGVVIADCKSGVTGAGIQAKPGSHYCAVADTIQAYKVVGHRHQPEIVRNLTWLTDGDVRLRFTPHLLPVRRGILATCYVPIEIDEEAVIREAVTAFYEGSPFVRLLPGGQQPSLARVAGTNRVELQVVADPNNGLVVVTCALDNLCKGSSGGAIQALNLALGLPESRGLAGLLPAVP
ncbi:MAG: N-acetyl-gamma-glutamyl-phosphate reductase [Myxococcales bacterium]|nr:N-acetyl-gamma-glutamyl-phosphate reductase [Myxococcales bacterium]|tara:strand:- start:208 stop:1257 length:1050 start_codon:yes stop_codon:yes gene_type:complete